MKDVKDTLGIKYDKYTTIYRMDNEQLGLLIKYLMWEHGKEVILQDLKPNSKERIIKYSEKMIIPKVNELSDNDIDFELVFTQMTQQVQKSHRCWQVLKDNLENKKNKGNDNETKTTSETKATEETTQTTTHENVDEEENEKYPNECYRYDETGTLHINSKLIKEQLRDSKYEEDDITMYIENNNRNDFFLPNGKMVQTIKEIIEEMESKGIKSSEELMLPIDI